MKIRSLIISLISLFAALAIGIFAGIFAFSVPSEKAEPEGTGKSAVALTPIAVEANTAEAVEYNIVIKPMITSNIWYGDPEKAHDYLISAKKEASSGKDGTYAAVSSVITTALTELGSFSRYFEYYDSLTYELDGVKYGAYTEEGDSPIGGGMGYKDIRTSGDYNVRTLKELQSALANAKSGEVVFIYGNAEINISTVIAAGGHLDIGAGVTLASDRGYVREDGTVSTGAIIYSTTLSSHTMSAQEGARITGIILKGGDPNTHLAHHKRSFSVPNAPGHSYYYKLTSMGIFGISCDGDGIEVDNCEIAGYAYAGVSIARDVKDAYIHHNYIHHNQGNGLGYGVLHNDGATSIVEYNLFNYNRHSIAATGKPTTGYIARFNIEMGSSLSHCFDIHGGADRKDNTNIAGTYCEMYNNTFLADTYPYWLRGVPEEYQEFHHNIVFKKRSDFANDKLTNARAKLYDNIFDINNKTLVK